MRTPPSCLALLDEQDGVLARPQALARGLTRHQWQWRISSGRWQQLLPGVVVAHTGPPAPEQLSWAAVLACGPGAALTGDAALRGWGLSVPAPDVWRVAVAGERRRSPRRSGPVALRVQPHRVVALPALRHPLRAPATPTPAAALLHAAAYAPTDRAAEWRVAAAVQQRLVTPGQVREALARLTRTRRRGLVAQVLDDVELGAHARSELDLLAFLRRHQLPLPDRLQLPVRALTGLRYVDAWWERPRVQLEVDGAHHRLVSSWESDLLRANALAVVSRDDRVLQLRVTAGQLRHDQVVVADQLRRVLL